MKSFFAITFLIILGFGLSGCTLPGQTPSPSATPVSQEPASDSQANAFSNIAAALQTGQSLKCTISNSNTRESFEYFLQGKKFRVDGVTMMDDKATSYHAISDSEYLYSWTDEATSGMKFKIPSESELKEQAEKYQEYTKNTPDFTQESVVNDYREKGYNIACNPSMIDAQMFLPPTSIKFQDLSQMMEQTQMQALPSLSPEQQRQMQEALKQFGQ